MRQVEHSIEQKQILDKVRLLLEETRKIQQQLLLQFEQHKQVLSSSNPLDAIKTFPQETELVHRLKTLIGHRQRLLQQAQQQGVQATTIAQLLQAVAIPKHDPMWTVHADCRKQAAELQQASWTRWVFTRQAHDAYRNRLVVLCNMHQNIHKDDLHNSDAELPSGGLLNASA